ncbi:MAG: NAD(P)H dehydrogenase [Omnitrophica bacterium RIFCSPLOWO2_12_FULL_44_17]|uniref:NAD(P)H dehydrogenase n=1 Tax=Candidatus Danuiimicrobium aquiferis TaxID=1801832 RepID=A0A1G1L2G5_9BACT|nr:MAG: NAD(P)H dehydrogenase [Omnitrophica bacterium RIFCSPHIGHO2_12_FULL_44_12]OGW99314.1 MAG: NAD(P)H dehydrogenase [Omnitrophica bacterium RIFCSPLOWO2_12_FULL_44_17]OGX04911.1 MAG: NAD(P)H dehydrogenase [Omnitrophica bacterium RIFCSPLOWO2_02_FULL_44_11]
MKYLIIYTHPNPKSFNHAIKENIEAKLKSIDAQFEIRDLYKIDFQPKLSGNDFSIFQQGKVPLDIEREQKYIKDADALIFIYPVWWFGMPAALKGYIDRVFSYGFAYEFKEKKLIGLLTDKKVVILNTTGGPEEHYQQHGFGAALQKTIDIGTFELCGMKVVLHQYFYEVPAVTQEARIKMLEEIKQLAI